LEICSAPRGHFSSSMYFQIGRTDDRILMNGKIFSLVMAPGIPGDRRHGFDFMENIRKDFFDVIIGISCNRLNVHWRI